MPFLCEWNLQRAVLQRRHGGPLLPSGGRLGSGRRGEWERGRCSWFITPPAYIFKTLSTFQFLGCSANLLPHQNQSCITYKSLNCYIHLFVFLWWENLFKSALCSCWCTINPRNPEISQSQVYEFPENAGIPVGGESGDTFYRLEIHYNNPASEEGTVNTHFMLLFES